MDRLLTYWWFWVGVVLICEGTALFFMMGWYKFHRVRNRKRLREIKILLKQTQDARLIGHHPCRFDEAVWHEGLCTQIACPSQNNRPKMGVLYHAHR